MISIYIDLSFEARTLNFGRHGNVQYVWDTDTLGHVPETPKEVFDFLNFFFFFNSEHTADTPGNEQSFFVNV